MKYLFPCTACGKPHTIDVSQAGQTLNCSCGATLEVPSLRGIRRLQPAGSVAAVRPRAWNPVRGLIMAAGMFVALLGALTIGYGSINLSHLDTTVPPPVDLTANLAEIDELSPADTLTLWRKIGEIGLGPYVLPDYVIAQYLARTCKTIMAAGGILLAVGTLVVGSAMLRRRRAPAAVARRS